MGRILFFLDIFSIIHQKEKKKNFVPPYDVNQNTPYAVISIARDLEGSSV